LIIYKALKIIPIYAEQKVSCWQCWKSDDICFPQVYAADEVQDIERAITEEARSFETIDYIYVISEDNVLLGVASIKELHSIEKKETKIEEIMTTKLVFAHPLTHQERIVYLALSHEIKAIPIVDQDKHLLGIVPFDAVLKVFNEEVREDNFRFGGIFHRVGKEYSTIKAASLTMVKLRVPWLIVGVLGGTITASVISNFENVLSTLLSLAAFMPVLAYMSDAVGTQSETLAVRSLALDPHVSLKSYFLRELGVAFILALVCGGLLSTVAFVGWQDPILGLIVGVSMFLSIICAVLISTGFPFIFHKSNFDPAVASGPFATMISDIVTVTIYLAVALLLLINFGRL
jgi:magnesium transporter